MEDGLDESASESLLVSIDTITSFIPEVFSWEDSNSSEKTWNERTDVEGGAERRENKMVAGKKDYRVRQPSAGTYERQTKKRIRFKAAEAETS